MRSPRRLQPAITRSAGAVALMAWAVIAAGAAYAAAPEPVRRALVIGNSEYRTAPLPNAVNDARSIARALDETGFRVTKLENASQKQMIDAVRAFGDDLRGGAIGLFYFAGHGVQVKGRNFLVPSDANISREDEIPYQAVDANQVLDKMETAKNPVNIMILDACRNNPFARGSRSGVLGLAQMDAPVGTLIAFATAPGAEASDGAGSNGVYTENLLRHIREPGLKIEDFFKRVRVGVRGATQNRQIPWENTSLEGDFFFVPPAAGASAGSQAAAADPKAVELAFWTSISTSRAAGDYQAYLERYPQGEFAGLARSRMQAMQPVGQARRGDARVAPGPAPAGGGGSFSFSQFEENERRAAGTRQDALATAAGNCSPARRRTPIRIEVSEQMNGPLREAMARPEAATVGAIAGSLREAGLLVEAGGPAPYVLRGSVSSQAGLNRLVRVSEISISAVLALVDANGRTVSSVLNREESFAGRDLMFAYADLARRQADEVSARIVRDFCTGG